MVAFALGAFAVLQLSRLRPPAEAHAAPESREGGHTEKEAPELARVEHEAGGVVKVVFSTNAAVAIHALTVQPVTNLSIPDETRAFGKVLDPAPLVALVHEQASLQSALTASSRDLERVRTLFAQDQNASARAVEAAVALAAVVAALSEAGFDGYVRPDHGRMIWGEQARPGYGLYDRALGCAYLNGLWEAIAKERGPRA